jgi:hypothetical protein
MRAPRLLFVGLASTFIGSFVGFGGFVGCGSSSSGNGGQADSGLDASVDVGTDVASFTHDSAPGDSPIFNGDGPQSDTSTNKKVTAIAVNPATATITSQNGGPVSQGFQAIATYDDGSSGPLSNADWSTDHHSIGSINTSGNFTAFGSLGGLVDVTATYGSLSAKATLIVQLHDTENPGHVSTNVQTALQNATIADPVVKWAYPYDQTVFPRGINESTLMWTGANATDQYYIHVKAATFELESYANAPQQWWDFTNTAWDQFLNSTAGPAEVKVARWNGAQATVIVDEKWTIANGSMRGTIYYSAYYQNQGVYLGKVLRLKPGAVTYDDFLDAGTTCTSCHTVSANGGTIVYNEGNWPPQLSDTRDLKSGTTVFSGFKNTASGYTAGNLNPDAGASQWAMAGLSADGTSLTENFAPLRGPVGAQTGLFDPTTGNPIANSGITKALSMPSFSPDGLLLVYVDTTTSDLRAYDWDPVNKVASNDRLLVSSSATPTSAQIQYPTVSPDHQWVVYQRSPVLGSLGSNGVATPGDLYAVSVAAPGTEIPLGALDGLAYNFAAGGRDQHLNYEPTFAPVAAGGYFWIVFHSRRTYGNKLTNPAFTSPGVGVKQLWVAAFDQSPAAGSDPSHPAFYLGGQSPVSLNTRGFWALSPCVPDGTQCSTGTDCCGGYCDGVSDAGVDGGDGGLVSVCGPPPAGSCSQDGDKCKTTADCCNAATGATCINGVCSEPPPPPDGGINTAN